MSNVVKNFFDNYVRDSLPSTPKGYIDTIVGSPTFVWFVSLWIFGIINMTIFNITRVGISGILSGPQYYSELFFNYGLNSEGSYTSPWESGLLAWIIAPFIAVWMGLPLFYLRDSGYAYNSNTRYRDPLLPPGDPFYAFFDKEVYGASVNLFGMKGNLFYLGIVWLPVVLASITTVIYMRRTQRSSSIVTRFVISAIIAFWVAIQIAKVTDPTIGWSIPGFFESVFVDRRNNNFVDYSGQYHPTSTATYFALFQIIPMIVLAIVDGSITTYRRIQLERELYQKRKEYQLERQKARGITRLPWEMDKQQDEFEGKEEG